MIVPMRIVAHDQATFCPLWMGYVSPFDLICEVYACQHQLRVSILFYIFIKGWKVTLILSKVEINSQSNKWSWRVDHNVSTQIIWFQSSEMQNKVHFTYDMLTQYHTINIGASTI